MSTFIKDRGICVFDLETTGVDTQQDKIVQVGIVHNVDGSKSMPAYETLVNPGMPIPAGAAKVHGITDDKVKDAPAFPAIADDVLNYLSGKDAEGDKLPIVCGYNAVGYDAPLFNAELARHGRDERLNLWAILDPMIFVNWHHRGFRSRKLGQVASYYGYELLNAHDAIADVKATVAIVRGMVNKGLIPPNIEDALRLQSTFKRYIDAEFQSFSFCLYRDRQEGFLRMGFGKNCGTALHKVAVGDLNYIAGNMKRLPPRVIELFGQVDGSGTPVMAA